MKAFVSVLKIKKVICVGLFVVFVVPAAMGQPLPLFDVTDAGGNDWLHVETDEAEAKGWVGIGTNAPQAFANATPATLLHLKGSGSQLQVHSTDGNRAKLNIYTQGDQPNDLFFGVDGIAHRYSLSNRNSLDGHDLRLYRNNSGWEVMTEWDWDTGNVGINMANPTAKLDVAGTINCTGGGTCGSDLRWKKNVETLDSALGKVMNLRGVSFDWRVDEFPTANLKPGRQVGLVAQEVMSVLPELVSEMATPRQDTDPENINPAPEPVDESTYYGINYMGMIPVLIEAMKEQQGIIDRQNATIDGQDTTIADLQTRMAAVEAALQKLGAIPEE